MSIKEAVTKNHNKDALKYFKEHATYPLTKGKIRSILHHRKVYWFGCKDSFRKNNKNWDNHIAFFNQLIMQK